MITFFRKIRHNLMQTGKTGRYFKYAIGEIVLVVIGILIALSINNWNESYKETKKEINYLKSLSSELSINETLGIEYKGFSEAQKESADYLANSISNKADVDQIKWLDALIRCFQLPHPNYSKDIWEELKATGDMAVIKNKELILQLSKYYNYIDYVKELEKEWSDTSLQYRNLTNEILDFNLRKKLSIKSFKKNELIFNKPSEDEDVISENQLDTYLSKLRQIDGLSGVLSDIYINKRVAAIVHETIEIQTKELKVHIEKEIDVLQ